MKRILFLLMLAFSSMIIDAQTGGGTDVKVDINPSGSSSAGIPWLWIIGGIVFIVLLIALLGRRGGTDRVVEKKTIIRE